MVNTDYWRGKRVLVTGHTGFKGSWLSHWLVSMGAEVHGYALAPIVDEALFNVIELEQRMTSMIADINDAKTLQQVVSKFQPDVIFHLAAQALVRSSYKDPLDTITTNVLGTTNLLEGAKSISTHCDVVIVTSDKCYQNKEQRHYYIEDDALGGLDPYSASKACAELVTTSYRHSYFSPGGVNPNIHLASARAGNVIGGGDWAEDRLIPDIIRSIQANTAVQVRNPNSVRPWQHVLEPISGYLQLAQKMSLSREYCAAFNFGPDSADTLTVLDILHIAQRVASDIRYEIIDDGGPHEAGLLMLNADAAQQKLQWQAKWDSTEAIEKTFSWYRAWQANQNMIQFTSTQINDYMQD